jgi:SAM-dependent methyltransferase
VSQASSNEFPSIGSDELLPNLQDRTQSRGTTLVCQSGHPFSVRSGVPDLVAQASAAAISDTFTAQWRSFEYGKDQTWNRSLDERVQGFMDHLSVDPEWLQGKRLLDAGCGHGELTNEVAARFAARAFGTDISESVFRANENFGGEVTSFRSHLSNSAIKPETFDAIYCGGVLHHTPSTKGALQELAPALKENGRLYVWLYWTVPSQMYRVKVFLRRFVAPLPPRVQQPIIMVFSFASWLRHGCRTAWRDHWLVQHDFWTPRYRWEHSPDEVVQWLRSMGFREVRPHSHSRDGFGILAIR